MKLRIPAVQDCPRKRSKRWCEGTRRMHRGLASHGHSSSEQSRGVDRTHRETPSCVHLNHAAQETLAVRWDEVWHVEHTALDLLQQLPQVVIIEGQSPLWVGRQDSTHRGEWQKRREGECMWGNRNGTKR